MAASSGAVWLQSPQIDAEVTARRSSYNDRVMTRRNESARSGSQLTARAEICETSNEAVCSTAID